MKKHNVVILEDDRVLAELIRKRVNDIEGFESTHCFENPLAFLASNVPAEIILLDIVMPEMNGLDAIEPILAKYPDAAIIMNTIRDDTETIFIFLPFSFESTPFKHRLFSVYLQIRLYFLFSNRYFFRCFFCLFLFHFL